MSTIRWKTSTCSTRKDFLVLFTVALGWWLPVADPFSNDVIFAGRQSHGCQGVRSQLYAFQRADKNPKRTRENDIRKLSASNDLMTNHKERLATAGREGTLRYADPTIVFIGNLNFTTTEEQLRSIILSMVPSPWDIAKIQIVRDWKTGDSKGYGFVRFTDPIYAALCLQELNEKEVMGRRLKVSAGKSKSESPLRRQQREEHMRLKALRRAQNPPPPPPEPKFENSDFLTFLDRDLMVPSLDNQEDDDDEVDGWEVPGSPAPRGFG